jgi:protein TonB
VTGFDPARYLLRSRCQLLQVFRDLFDDTVAQLRTDPRQRLIGFVLALLAEAGLVLVMLSLGWGDHEPARPKAQLVSVAIEAEQAKAPDAKVKDPAKPAAARETPQKTPTGTPAATNPVPAPPAPVTPTQPIIPVNKDQMAQFDLSKMRRPAARPAAPGKGMMGPPDHGVPGDSKRVGTAPNGQPMYAATWYREPYDDELRGYLSTAQGPGWALITCRTASDFRVEDCVGLDEYPDGSQIQRAVLGAAWQFRVRPPRVGGVSQVGAWVRIRIDYTQRQSR